MTHATVTAIRHAVPHARPTAREPARVAPPPSEGVASPRRAPPTNDPLAGVLARAVENRALLQRLRFRRFEGADRLWNWFYSTAESDLLALERRVSDAIDDLERFFATQSQPPPAGVAGLRSELDDIRRLPVADDDIAHVRARLQKLLRDADEESSRQAVVLGAEKDFARRSFAVPPDGSALLDLVRQLAMQDRAADVDRMRDALDALSQWASDALLKAAPERRPALLMAKETAAIAAGLVNEAFYHAAVKHDFGRLVQRYGHACALLRGSELDALRAVHGTVPKKREDHGIAFDPGALMLAAALSDDEFVPQLVVGLPTGGAHAANQLAGALGVKHGRRPIVWYTRPRAVKPETKALMEGVGKDEMLGNDEIDLLASRLPRGTHTPVNVLVIDDGVISGGTLALARDWYAEVLGARVGNVVVRTAVVKGGRGNEWDTLPSGLANTVDYVVNQTDDRAGPRAALAIREPNLEAKARTFDVGVSLTAPVAIHSSTGSRNVPLRDTL